MRRMLLRNSSVEVSRYPGLSRFGDISHFVTSRAGGVSEGNYASMNLGLYSGDSRERVDENIRRLMTGLGLEPERLLLPRQVHGCRVAWLTGRLPSFLVWKGRPVWRGLMP